MSELVVECPTCQKKVEWKTENKYRPFCSDRCHLIDLGEWANEEKRIPAVEAEIFSEILEMQA
ncbi:DNA gyrase inhibitor YacG [Haemophilus paraphrohaemolyticus]|uniref:DNA gyrase inhibitor YacG n=1 Tax=Haemophilus paraphrohaemolyticus HK411 TaxID=1095743 RepID=I2NFL6_9PAST|nr:DNA gyrase inhibitor YacG [Haemophilus paraphrohaemolyticus]EIG24627.1 PF03884 domain protein [Haemophilus paraphrohaemolyticus HK411]OOR93835.1 DNA gyrase inhibitor YacG [Haemophilus paraphrohaemolyticus]STP02013.1 DNA gyrase inhibitor YacG [Haemophilus paraphrohaemolyticus]